MTTPPALIRSSALITGKPTRLVLVRHGEARCNVDGLVGGILGCKGLTENGKTQVSRLGKQLFKLRGQYDFEVAYSSILPRAIETAAILLEEAKMALHVQTDCDLCELHPGDADGMSWDEYGERFPEPKWDVDPSLPFAPQGESWIGFLDRVEAALLRIAALHEGKNILIATHAGVIGAAVARFLPVDQSINRLHLSPNHASLTSFVSLTKAISDIPFMLDQYNVTY